jgi:hypothetical protein
MSDEKDIILECDFAFKCPKKWEYLDTTDDDSKRFCFSCEQEVFFVTNRDELEANRKLGRCVAAHITDATIGIGRIIAGSPVFYPPDIKPENRLTLAIFGDDEETTQQLGEAIDNYQMKKWKERIKKKSQTDNNSEKC